VSPQGTLRLGRTPRRVILWASPRISGRKVVLTTSRGEKDDRKEESGVFPRPDLLSATNNTAGLVIDVGCGRVSLA